MANTAKASINCTDLSESGKKVSPMTAARYPYDA